jgi:DNA-binding MarR family transcriptional regulator
MNKEDELINSIYRCGEFFGRRSMEDFVTFAKESGLSMPQINILMHLYYYDACEMAKVKAFSSGNFAAASQIVDRLEEQGMVERFSHAEDRRIRMVRLTGQGREMVKGHIFARQQWIYTLASQFTEQEQDLIIQSLNLLAEKTDEL